MAKIDKIQDVELEQLRPYARNAKIHGKKQVEQIAKSIQEFGFISPILIDKDYNVIAGHGRIEACKKIGLTKVPCVFIEGLTEEQRRAYILADNKLTELGDWDMDLVSEELSDLKELGFDFELTGFTVDDIIFDEDDEIFDQDEEEGSLEQKCEPRIKRGEIWELGDHRLMCGDSTSPDDLEKLLGGVKVDLLLTDPPYNVNYGAETHVRKDGKTIQNDNMDDESFQLFLNAAVGNAASQMKLGASYYIWMASSKYDILIRAIENSGLLYKQEIVWVKNNFTLGRQDYQWRHEPCAYGWKDGASHYFIDIRSFSTVWDKVDLEEMPREEAIDRLRKIYDTTTVLYAEKPTNSELHPTMKPVSLFKKQIRNSTEEGQTVLDIFGGSGTSLIACEEMNRKCFMMELDEEYAENIIARWEEATGKVAVKL